MNELMQAGGAYIRKMRAAEVAAQERAYTKRNRKLIAQNKHVVLPGLMQRDIDAPWPVRAAATVRNAWKGLWA